MARHGGPSIFTWKMAHFCFASVFRCFNVLVVVRRLQNPFDYYAFLGNFSRLSWLESGHLIVFDKHDSPTCNSSFLFLQMCMGVFVVWNKTAKAFDLLCIWRCFFKVVMAWNWYDYYIKSFSRTCITDASRYAWF